MRELLLLLALIFTYDANARRQYLGYSVLRVQPTSLEQLSFLHNLVVQGTQDIDFWTLPSSINKSIDIMVGPERFRELSVNLSKLNLNTELLIDDVESLIHKDNELKAGKFGSLLYRTPDRDKEADNFFKEYQRIDQIFAFMRHLYSENKEIVNIVNIGRSSEGRNLRMIQIGEDVRNESKPVIYMDAGVHAREWITITTLLYIANKLVHGYNNKDSDIVALVKKYDWYIMPVANPDGYEYTHTKDRMWRKTRSVTNSILGCKGVDPNRNFDFHWNEVGASSNPCSEIYAGPMAFSEPETRAMRNFILKHRERIKIALAAHSYSQVWLTPWGWTSKFPHDYNDLEAKARIAVKALSSVYGTNYKIGSSTNLLYAAAGGSDDWCYGVAKIKYVYTIELRDLGNYGFVLPTNQIIPTGEETWAGVKALAEAVASKNESSEL